MRTVQYYELHNSHLWETYTEQNTGFDAWTMHLNTLTTFPMTSSFQMVKLSCFRVLKTRCKQFKLHRLGLKFVLPWTCVPMHVQILVIISYDFLMTDNK